MSTSPQPTWMIISIDLAKIYWLLKNDSCIHCGLANVDGFELSEYNWRGSGWWNSTIVRPCWENVRQVTILMGKKANPVIPLQKILNISLEVTGDPVQGNPHKIVSVNEDTKRSDFEVPLNLDPCKIWLVATQTLKKLPRWVAPHPDHTMCNSSPIYGSWSDGSSAVVQTKTDSVSAWLFRFYYMGAESLVVNGLDIWKLASITAHPALRLSLYTTFQNNEENHSEIKWLMAACCITWPNKSDIALNTDLWSSMEGTIVFEN